LVNFLKCQEGRANNRVDIRKYTIYISVTEFMEGNDMGYDKRGAYSHHEYEVSDSCFIILNELTHTFTEES